MAYAIEIARALEAAHDRRIVHRDVKPQNVLIDEEGTAKVTDFGIARSLTEEGLTADGRVLGTTDYVSPEQALGHDVGPQSDLYSLGVVLYEMLTGDVPVPRREPGRRGDEARPRGAARRADAPARGVERAGGGRRPRDGQGPRPPLRGPTRELIEDLEDVLGIEAARSGQATGEATAVIRTLPPQRPPAPADADAAPGAGSSPLLALRRRAAAAVVLVFMATERTERGTGTRNVKPPAPGLVQVSLGQSRAKDFDPFGGDGEHPDEAKAVVDQDRQSTWSTEQYEGGTLNAKPGVGIYVDAKPSVEARVDGDRVARRRAGAARSTPPRTARRRPSCETSRASPRSTRTRRARRVRLNTDGKRYRYYLVWITKPAARGEHGRDRRDPPLPPEPQLPLTLTSREGLAVGACDASGRSRAPPG